MADGAEPVVIDGRELTTRDEALGIVANGDDFNALVPPDAAAGPDATRAAVKGYAEQMWNAGGLLSNNSTFTVTPEGINKAVSICHEGAGHAQSVLNTAGAARPFLSKMFGSCAEGVAHQQALGQWLDKMGEKATNLEAILNGVADGTQEIQVKAEQTDSEWAHAFRKTNRTSNTGGGA